MAQHLATVSEPAKDNAYSFTLVALPLGGSRDGAYVNLNNGRSGNYWCATPDSENADYAWFTYFHPSIAYTDNYYRRYGYPVRLVSVQ